MISGIKLKKIFVLLILFYNISFTQQKKDVLDPLLQSIISHFSTRMPKFIDRYGKDRFVSDEPINRGSLLFVLYEYDQSIKDSIPSDTTTGNFVSKKEFDILKNKFLSLEERIKSGGLPSATTKKSTSDSSIDIFAIMNELTPNMPMLLDSTLSKSEIFKSLKQEIEMLKSLSGGMAVGNTSQVRGVDTSLDSKKLDLITSRLEKLEKNFLDIEKVDRSSTGKKQEEVIFQDSKQIASLSLKVDKLEKNILDLNTKIDSNMSQKKLESGNEKQIMSLETKLDKLEKKYLDITSIVDKISLSTISKSQTSQSKEVSDNTIASITNRLERLEKNYNYLGNKIENIDKTTKSSVVSSKSYEEPKISYSKETEIGTYVSVITKLSLGVSMLALLFVAR